MEALKLETVPIMAAALAKVAVIREPRVCRPTMAAPKPPRPRCCFGHTEEPDSGSD